MAEKLGAKILGLGAFTSVVGDAGVTIANALDVPVTTGNSFTVAMAVQAIREAAQCDGHSLGRCDGGSGRRDGSDWAGLCGTVG